MHAYVHVYKCTCIYVDTCSYTTYIYMYYLNTTIPLSHYHNGFMATGAPRHTHLPLPVAGVQGNSSSYCKINEHNKYTHIYICILYLYIYIYIVICLYACTIILIFHLLKIRY